VREQRVDQALVEVEAWRVHRASTGRQDPTPRHTEAIRAHAELPHELYIAGVAPVVIAGHIAGVAVAHHARGVREPLPDARPGAVGERRALDLVCGRGGAPE